MIERRKCPLCYNDDYSVFCSMSYDDPMMRKYISEFYGRQGGTIDYNFLKGYEYALIRCHTCGLIFQKWILDDAEQKILYEQWINTEVCYNISEKPKPIVFYNQIWCELLNVINYIGKLPSEMRILDIGCGFGSMLIMARSMGGDCYGIEINQNEIEYLKKHSIKMIKNPSEVKGGFNFINVNHVLEHVNEPRTIILDCINSKSSNGCVIKMSFPFIKDAGQINVNQILKCNQVAPLEHINTFTEESVNFIDNFNFKKIKRVYGHEEVINYYG